MQRSRLPVRQTAGQAHDGNQPRQAPGSLSPAGKELSGHTTTP